jgi:hypothetical protein
MLGLGYRRRGHVVGDVTCNGDALASLVSAWSDAVISTGLVSPGDWWHPAVEATATAVLEGADPGPALARLGEARAQAGVGVTEALGEVEALFAATHGGEPPYRAVRAYVEGYGDALLGIVTPNDCEDPLTGLATMPYLRTRVTEEYREAARDGTPVTHRAAFVVVDTSADDRGGLLPAVGMIEVAQAMRTVFSGGETCAVISRRCCVALVPRRHELARSVQLLHEVLSARSSRLPNARSWVEGLPPRESGAAALLTELAR